MHLAPRDQELITSHIVAARHEILSLVPAWPTSLRNAYLRPRTGALPRPSSRIVVSETCRFQAERPVSGRQVRPPEIRLGGEFSLFLLVVDRRIAICWDTERRSDGPVIKSAGELDRLIGLFEQRWAGAQPVKPVSVPPISDIERSIIQHLAVGMTDEAAANALKISTRTVQRHVTNMMAQLGARSRLELGVCLASADLV